MSNKSCVECDKPLFDQGEDDRGMCADCCNAYDLNDYDIPQETGELKASDLFY